MWAKFINAEHEEEFRNLKGRDDYMDSALRQLEVISQDPDMRMEYEARQKAIRDHNQLMKESEQRGIEIGEQRGIEIGEQRGEQRKAEETARNFLAMGLSVEQVANGTGLTVEQVKALQSATETAT